MPEFAAAARALTPVATPQWAAATKDARAEFETMEALREQARERITFLISHRMALEDAPKGYKMFHDNQNEVTKVVLKPDLAMAAE